MSEPIPSDSELKAMSLGLDEALQALLIRAFNANATLVKLAPVRGRGWEALFRAPSGLFVGHIHHSPTLAIVRAWREYQMQPLERLLPPKPQANVVTLADLDLE